MLSRIEVAELISEALGTKVEAVGVRVPFYQKNGTPNESHHTTVKVRTL